MKDIFERIKQSTGGPIGQYRKTCEGYFIFPKLEGELGPHMKFRGKEVLCWSLNNYLGLANHPEVRKADAEGAAQWGITSTSRSSRTSQPTSGAWYGAIWSVKRQRVHLKEVMMRLIDADQLWMVTEGHHALGIVDRLELN